MMFIDPDWKDKDKKNKDIGRKDKEGIYHEEQKDIDKTNIVISKADIVFGVVIGNVITLAIIGFLLVIGWSSILAFIISAVGF